MMTPPHMFGRSLGEGFSSLRLEPEKATLAVPRLYAKSELPVFEHIALKLGRDSASRSRKEIIRVRNTVLCQVKADKTQQG